MIPLNNKKKSLKNKDLYRWLLKANFYSCNQWLVLSFAGGIISFASNDIFDNRSIMMKILDEISVGSK